MTRYLTLEDVLRQVERAGWVVRDAGLLASAVARPSASAFGQDAYGNLWLKAAALCQSLDNNQALVDGNKRLAWLTTKVFLAVNGQQLRASADDGEHFMLELVAGHADLESVAGWLAYHCSAAEPPDLSQAPTR
ncbi:MAG: type II toxin-antitoxin system death-on-curing family toxin [Jatrophihabitantaceae bacterium]